MPVSSLPDFEVEILQWDKETNPSPQHSTLLDRTLRELMDHGGWVRTRNLKRKGNCTTTKTPLRSHSSSSKEFLTYRFCYMSYCQYKTIARTPVAQWWRFCGRFQHHWVRFPPGGMEMGLPSVSRCPHSVSPWVVPWVGFLGSFRGVEAHRSQKVISEDREARRSGDGWQGGFLLFLTYLYFKVFMNLSKRCSQ